MALQMMMFFLVFTAFVCIGLGILFLFGRSQSIIRDRLRASNHDLPDEVDQTNIYALHRIAHSVGSKVAPSGTSSTLRRDMIRAGFREQSAPTIFIGIKLFFLFLSIAVIFSLIPLFAFTFITKVLVVIIAIGFSFFIPNVVLEILAHRRKAEVVRHLPDVVDLLEVCVSGGMGLDQAWMSVSDEIRTVCPLLADEMALTNLEIHLGEERGTAIRHMAERTGADDLSSLVATLVQSERFGTSVAEALIVFAKNLRELRSMRAEEEAEKLAVKMLFPMMFFIFPVELIIAVGPAALSLMDTLGE